MRKAGLSIFSRPQLDKDFYKRNLNDDTLIKKKIYLIVICMIY